MNEQPSKTPENYPFFLPDWQERLQASDLSKEEQYGFAVTIRWYLSYCIKIHMRTTYASARQFLEHIKEEKHPSEAIYQKWRAGLRWFFQEAKSAKSQDAFEHMLEPALDWECQLVRKLRVAKMAYRTEKTYRYWCQRCWKFWNQMNPADFTDKHVSGFLDDCYSAPSGW